MEGRLSCRPSSRFLSMGRPPLCGRGCGEGRTRRVWGWFTHTVWLRWNFRNWGRRWTSACGTVMLLYYTTCEEPNDIQPPNNTNFATMPNETQASKDTQLCNNTQRFPTFQEHPTISNLPTIPNDSLPFNTHRYLTFQQYPTISNL